MSEVWRRSVVIDGQGLPWIPGVRADFIYVLFMHGYSVKELRRNLIDGYDVPTKAIEDAIRYGMWAARNNSATKEK